MQEIFRAGAEGEGERQAACRRHRGADAFHGLFQRVDGRIHTPAGIFDGSTHQPAGSGLQQGVCTALRVVREAVLQVGRHRQGRGCHDGAGIGQGFLAADLTFAIGSAKRKGQAGAGGGQGFEAQRREYLRRAGIPRVGQYQQFVALMQCLEGQGFLQLRIGHAVTPWVSVVPVGLQVAAKAPPTKALLQRRKHHKSANGCSPSQAGAKCASITACGIAVTSGQCQCGV